MGTRHTTTTCTGTRTSAISSHSYTYDDSSNITADINNLAGEFSEQCAFDDLDRLLDANRNGGNFQDWVLDGQGNWAGFTDEGTSRAPAAPRRAAGDGSGYLGGSGGRSGRSRNYEPS